MDESFKLYRKYARPTSIMAAESVYPHLTVMKNRIIEYAAEVGPYGFTDIEMNEHFDTIKSTYRARRSEITREGIIVDSERLQWHDRRWHTIWVHKDYKKDLT